MRLLPFLIPFCLLNLLDRFFQQSLFFLFLALNTVASPGDSLQALGVDLIAATNALTKCTFTDPLQCGLHHVQQLPVIVALREKKLFGVRVGCAISNVLRRVLIGDSSVFFGPAYGFSQ